MGQIGIFILSSWKDLVGELEKRSINALAVRYQDNKKKRRIVISVLSFMSC